VHAPLGLGLGKEAAPGYSAARGGAAHLGITQKINRALRDRLRAVFLLWLHPRRPQDGALGLTPVLVEPIVGKIEIALHSLNDSVYGVAGLVSIGSAKLDTPDGPIRF
jgi:hypothetical protein